MSESRSLLQDVDDASTSDESLMQMPEDQEKGNPLLHRQRRRWYHWLGFERGRLLWALFFALGLFSVVYLLSWLAKNRELLTKLSKLDAFGGSNGSLQLMKKPEDFPIIAVVFYGRRQFVNVLDCYLQRNLARNGGYLDEVHFAIHTDKQDDLTWLDELVARTPGYKAIDSRNGSWGDIWKEHMQEPGTLYIKMDDDITYIHDDAIPRIVQTLLEHPEAYAITANAINSVAGGWIHYHRNAILPYLPEPSPPTSTDEQRESSWRPSELPLYPEDEHPPRAMFDLDAAPARNHQRWLPLQRNGKNIHKTPIDRANLEDWGPSHKKWGIAAQQHYSFLANLEADRLDRYYLGGGGRSSSSTDSSSDNPSSAESDGGEGGQLWNMQNARYSINFVAIWGATVAASEIGDRDEPAIAMTNPREMGRPFYIESRAIVAHFSYSPQYERLLKTDLLGRYRALANEGVCSAENQKREIGFP